MKVNLRYILTSIVVFIALFAINSNVRAFTMPVNSTDIDFGYGGTDGGVHKESHPGIDINVPDGSNVYAAHSGVVVNRNTGCANEYSDCNGTGGNTVSIQYVENGQIYYDKYLHNSEILVNIGDTITEGTVIALSGHSGAGDHPHLHYQRDKDSGSGSFQDSVPVNPLNYDFPAIGILANNGSGLTLADSKDGTVNRPSASVLNKNNRLNGLTCQSFIVGPGTKPAEWGQCSEVKNGKCYGPWIKNQVDWRYEVKVDREACPGDTGSYTAFCVDPTRDGAYHSGYNYIAQTVSEESGKRFAALFKLFQVATGGGRPSDEQYFIFEAAARIIAADPASKFNGVASTGLNNERYASHLSAYKNGGDPSIIRQEAIDYAKEAIAMTTREDFINSIQGSMLGVRANTTGGYIYENGGYSTHLTVVVENWDGQAIDWGNISIEGASAEPVSGAVEENRAAHTKSFTFKLNNVISEGDCSAHQINVALTYTTSGIDIRNVMMLVPENAREHNLQRYVVFENGAGTSRKITYPVSLKNCPGGGDSCGANNTLICGPDDSNFVVINEGADGNGPTDWNCIFDREDSQGNSYNVVDTRGLVKSEDESVYSVIGSEIDAYLSDGREVKDANYCVISCKEKYAFLLPGSKKNVKQGTYFSFNVAPGIKGHEVVGISAERLCVSREVKNEEYNNVAKDLRLQQVDFLNMYLYYKQLYDILRTNKELDAYKNTKTKATCDVIPKEGIEIDEFPSYDPTDCDGIIYKDTETRFTQQLPAYGGSDNEYTIKYYVAVGADTVDGFELQESSLKINPKQSFKEALAANGKQLQNKQHNYNMYQSKYGDYKEAWETKFGVEEFKKEKSNNYKISYCTDSREQCTDVGLSSEHCETHCSIPVYNQDRSVTVHYLPGSGEEEYWNHYDLNRGGNNVYEKYRDALGDEEEGIMHAYKKAYEKYIAIMQQIELQAESIQECTNYLEISDNSFSFNPDITFSYPDQQAYMEMLAPNKLVNVNQNEAPTVDYKQYYSEGPATPEELFSGDATGAGATKVDFKYLYFFEDEDHPRQATFNRELTVKAEEKLNDITYHNAGTVGSRATYGRYDPNGNNCTGGKYEPGAGSVGDYCYEFYRSAKQFYTTPQSGIVSIRQYDNSSLIDTDGYVYPVAITTPKGKYPYYVKFANIGQFGDINGAALGRIMGGGNGKPGTMSGEMYDTEVCYYKVTRIEEEDGPYCVDKNGDKIPIQWCLDEGRSEDECKTDLCPDGDDGNYCIDPYTKEVIPLDDCMKTKSKAECEKIKCPKKETCDNIMENDCNNGNITDPVWETNPITKPKYTSCAKKLMDIDGTNNGEICCRQMDTLLNVEGSGGLPIDVYDKYMKYCDDLNECVGFDIITTDTYSSTISQTSDIIGVENNGALQLNARVVSNNNLFPNGNKGVNWRTKEGLQAIRKIENIGDGIFGGTPDYHAHVNTECMTAIREYNRRQEGSSTNDGSGAGFSDYTLNVTADTRESETPRGIDNNKGMYATAGDEFRALLRDHCGVEDDDWKASPDEIKDESRVRT